MRGSITFNNSEDLYNAFINFVDYVKDNKKNTGFMNLNIKNTYNKDLEQSYKDIKITGLYINEESNAYCNYEIQFLLNDILFIKKKLHKIS